MLRLLALVCLLTTISTFTELHPLESLSKDPFAKYSTVTPIGHVESIKGNGDDLYLLTRDSEQKKLSMWKYDQSVDDFGVLENFEWMESEFSCKNTNFELFQNVGEDHKRFLMSCQRADSNDSVYLHTLKNGWKELHTGFKFIEMQTTGSEAHGWRYLVRFENMIRIGDLFTHENDQEFSSTLFDNGHISAVHFWGADKLIVIGVDNLYLVYNGIILIQCPVPARLVDGGSSYTDQNLWVLAEDAIYKYSVQQNVFMKVRVNIARVGDLAKRTSTKIWHLKENESDGPNQLYFEPEGHITHGGTFQSFKFLPSGKKDVHGNFVFLQEDILVDWAIKDHTMRILAVNPRVKKVTASAHGAHLYVKSDPKSDQDFDRIIRVNGDATIDFILDLRIFPGLFIESFQIKDETDAMRQFVIFMKNKNNNKITLFQVDYNLGAMYQRYITEIDTIKPSKYNDTQHLVTYNSETGMAMVCNDTGCVEKDILRQKTEPVIYEIETFGANAVWNTEKKIVMMAGFDTIVHKKDSLTKKIIHTMQITNGGTQYSEIKSSDGKNLIYGTGKVWNFEESSEDNTDNKFIMNQAYDQMNIEDNLVILKNKSGISIHNKNDLNKYIYAMDYKQPEDDHMQDPFLYKKKFDLTHQVYTTKNCKFSLQYNPATDKVMLGFRRKDHEGRLIETSDHHLEHPMFNFMRKKQEAPMMLSRKERILAEEDGEWMTLETETEFLSKDNLRFTVRVAALISILVAILGSVWLVMRVIWKQGKEEFIENPVKVGNTPGRLSESYAQQEERQERYRDAKYRANIRLYDQMNSNPMSISQMY